MKPPSEWKETLLHPATGTGIAAVLAVTLATDIATPTNASFVRYAIPQLTGVGYAGWLRYRFQDAA